MTVSPNGLTYLVNKDTGGARWTIAVNLVASGQILTFATTLFRADWSPGNSMNCKVRPDSECTSLIRVSASTQPAIMQPLQRFSPTGEQGALAALVPIRQA